VALLMLLVRHRAADLTLHIVHLDHETRGGASAEDAEFVRRLAGRLGLDSTIEKRSAVEARLDHVEPNIPARFRAARLALFRRAVEQHALAGVLLAHHADDQAETIFHRLIRGSGAAGLAGMSPAARVGGVLLCRPLLGLPREALREYLRGAGEAWREDISNESSDYVRNRLRRHLADEPKLSDALLRLGLSCLALRDWIHARTPKVTRSEIRVSELLAVPAPLRRELARHWLRNVGVPDDRVDPDVVGRLLMMAEDAASASRQHFPGEVLVRRSRGVLSASRK
jgi:tRNA(Ile)-lysidine synthetase-like protein